MDETIHEEQVLAFVILPLVNVRGGTNILSVVPGTAGVVPLIVPGFRIESSNCGSRFLSPKFARAIDV